MNSCEVYVKIIEQPASNHARFSSRYEEFYPLLGVSSTPWMETCPTIQVVGYQGKAIVVVSCVTKEKPYRPHPFNITGREGCKKGVCSLYINPKTMAVKFDIGITYVKKDEIIQSLKQRLIARVDPFRTGFDMKQTFDFHSVRLAFQVFLESKKGKFTIPLPPVVSDPIYDSNQRPDLEIRKISISACRVDEAPEIIMLCGKIYKDGVKIRFYETCDGVLIWQDYGIFTSNEIIRRRAICFRPPKYFNQQIENPVKVQLQLFRCSDGITSMSVPFEFLPSREIRRRRMMSLDFSQFVCKNCNYNPFMNIRSEAINPQNPFLALLCPPSDNMRTNTYSSNISSTVHSSQIQQESSNIPYADTNLPRPSCLYAQQNIPNNPPNVGSQNAACGPIPQPMNVNSEIYQTSGAPNFEFFNNKAKEQNSAYNITKLITEAFKGQK